MLPAGSIFVTSPIMAFFNGLFWARIINRKRI
jgi:hypothetical protein